MMAESKQKIDIKHKPEIRKQQLPELFTKANYTWMIVGAVIVALGMILMSGGKNQDPNTFDYNVVYSTTRITVAPILIVAGLLVEVYAIFKKSNQPADNAA
jgi:heme/copper-type cytochrome/quinol oxidase subunit 2